ncbi:unnamed protein product [Somion occarium]|uniref:Uncharacterized protein n=1 Tax=Somion occarium TaxID=3059160 RepID=A0ABP1CL51_9APHY
MATIETLDLADHPSQADGENAVQQGTFVQGSPTKTGDEAASPSKPDGLPLDSAPATPSPGSSSTPLRPTVANGQATPGTTHAPILSMPHPKKFSSVNINKKFLERSSSSSGPAQTASTSLSSKAGITNQKPNLQATPSHSRLVTAKLTAGPQPSTLTGPGWSRPPSTGSSVPTPVSNTNPKPTPLPAPTLSQPSAGKVPPSQSRTPLEGPTSSLKKDAGSRPAWGHSKLPGATLGSADAVQNDFPTAAESAQVRAAKLNEKRQAVQAAQAQKQALAAEADAFRGVHLKNAHHWDEDEEDDADFLEGVIDFGDGRQYKIQPSEPSRSPPHEVPELAPEAARQLGIHPERPVKKEERFADDFDRSWPRSRGSESFPSPQPRERFPHGPPSSASSQSMHSPQESSRVLFNERSNRLEPWSSSHPSRYGPPPRDSYFSRRDSRSDHAVSPTESRGGRELPPHRQGVQLLQKPPSESGGEGPPRSRVFGDRFGPDSSRFRDKDTSRRDYGPPPHMARGPSQGVEQPRSRERDHYNPLSVTRSPVMGPARGMMGPPPMPALRSPQSMRDDDRQIPPHLAKLQTSQPQSPTSAVSDQHPPLEPPSATETAPILSATQSPAVSHASMSPLVEGSTMPIVDIDEVRKAAMHSAAERAKLRRQHEEEERERERERARRKAAELEAKMKAMEDAKKVSEEAAVQAEPAQKDVSDAQVIEIIEDAVSSVTTAAVVPNGAPLPSVPEEGSSKTQSLAPIRTSFARPPSVKGVPRTAPARRSSFNTQDGASFATETNSWRNTAAPPPPRSAAARGPSKSLTSPASVIPPPPLSLPAVDALSLAPDEELEVFDFSEIGKMVGEIAAPPAQQSTARSRPRPVAIDFFDDAGQSQPTANDAQKEQESWRKSVPPITEDAAGSQEVQLDSRPTSLSPPAQAPLSQRRLSTSSDDHARVHTGHSLAHPLKSPVSSSYREASLLVLDDTMARIKGAIDGMQKPEPTKSDVPKAEPAGPDEIEVSPRPEPPKTQLTRWLPPALRARAVNHDEPPREIFDVTADEPPRSPKPVWNTFSVKFPSVSHPREHIPRKQLNMSKTQPHIRSDIYTFDPPIEHMNRRDFHLNDIFFRKPLVVKGRVKYTVLLPSRRATSSKAIGPVVNLPAKSVAGFGRKNGASDGSSWRKPPPSPLSSQPAVGEEGPQTLETVSRSPPPESSSVKTTEFSERPTVSVTAAAAAKSRPQPKMPAGTDVAFYRDSRAEDLSKQAKATVKFIVSSELEEEPSSVVGGFTNHDATSPAPKADATDKVAVKADGLKLAPEVKRQSAAELGPNSPARSNSLPWPKPSKTSGSKDSPSRAPDPEHLKAVWSSPAHKSSVSPVNSLENIGDDLTGVPFTIQDVKSEGGETPPPPSSGPPSRMSLHDVTRAFQQVPTSSSSLSSSHRTGPLSGLSSPSAAHRQPVPTHPPSSVPTPNLRPMYPAYPSPMLSSPSPTMVYPMSMTPSPVPRHMVVPGPSQYPQPMWVPVPGPPPPPGTMMRPMASPYGPQYMPYPTGAPMYAGHPQSNAQGSMPPPQPNGVSNRPNGVNVMSPVLAHANPMYAPSPVLMHTPVSALPPGHTYPNHSQQPRGQGQSRGELCTMLSRRTLIVRRGDLVV